jgi:hypothetical protein
MSQPAARGTSAGVGEAHRDRSEPTYEATTSTPDADALLRPMTVAGSRGRRSH